MATMKELPVEFEYGDESFSKLRFDLPDDGAMIIVPYESYHPYKLVLNYELPANMSGDSTFTPIRVLFDLYLTLKGNDNLEIGPGKPFELITYFTASELSKVRVGKTLKLAYWKQRSGKSPWNIIPDSEIVELKNPSWKSNDVEYIGYVRVSLANWGDPPIAVGS